MKKIRTQIYSNWSFSSLSTIIGVLLIITGILFLMNPNNLRIKVGASAILNGILCLLLVNINEKHSSKTITSQQLTLILTVWIFLGLIISYNIDADIALITVILGLLIIIEFLSDFFSSILKKRKVILFYFLIIAFIIVMEQRILNIIHF